MRLKFKYAVKRFLASYLAGPVFLLFLLSACLPAAKDTLPDETLSPVFAVSGMAATQEAAASRVGIDILREGGNAVDAAVAIGFTLAVTLPEAGNLGGGGFMIVHNAKSGQTLAIDYREMAPASSTRDMFLDDAGEVSRTRAQFSHLSAGVPGTVAGLALALENYGTLPLRQVLAPAIRLANEGIIVTPALAVSLKKRQDALRRWPETKKIFFKPDGGLYAPGDTLVQKDLARTLQAIADKGPRAFYQGEIGDRLAEDMQAHGGWITKADLKNYQVKIREPVRGTYRGYEIVSMPPPSSGGVHLIQMLNILENENMRSLGARSAETLHLMAESMKLAYADRSRHLGDSGFWKVPVSGLIAKTYAAKLNGLIDLNRATASAEIQPHNPVPYESRETTHFSVMDRDGNAVANTYTLNFSYGSGIVAAGTGILLNNEMDDFSAKPGVPNAYGLIGGGANAIEPGKRPLSSMTPTLVFRNGKPFLVTGSPGGSRIITTTLQIILNVIDHGMTLGEATRAPRIHHQWLPDQLEVEPGFATGVLNRLRDRGHAIVATEPFGSTQSILRTEAGFFGASDPRSDGAAAMGF